MPVQTDLSLSLKQISYGLFRIADFCWSMNLNVEYQASIEEAVGFSMYQEVSRKYRYC